MKIKIRAKFSWISVVVIAVLLAEVFIVNNVSKTYAATIPEKFDLRDEISIVVKSQGPNSICPHMSRSTVVETAVKLGQKNGKYQWFKETPVFSVLTYKNAGNYVAISTDKTEKIINDFFDGEYKTEQDLINVEKEYGNAELQKKFAELEPSLDTENNGKRDRNNITRFTYMAAILKEYDANGVLKYKSNKGVEYSQNELKDIRNEIKETIMNKGALVCSIQTTGIRDGLNGGSVCCNKVITTAGGDHSVAIIGWDDNYSKDNFPEEIRPSSNGAYLIQNSWGENWGDRGTFWVSYEDLYVEMFISYVDDIIEYKDVTIPVISDVLSEDEKKITINVTDKYGSGVDESSIKYKWTDHNILPDVKDSTWTSVKNGETINNEENKYIWIYARDNAGNENLSVPENSAQGLIIENIPEGWCTKDVELSIKDVFTLLNQHKQFKIIASSSTISPEELQAMDKELENYDHKFTINKDGKHTIYFSKVDEDGRECLAKKIDIWVDKTAPTKPTITLNGLTVTISPGEDKTSGVKETIISVTDINRNPIEIENKTKFDLNRVGIYLIEVTTIDNAGNKATAKKSIEVKDDGEEPTTPGDDDKKDEDPTKPGDDDKKDEDPTKPGDDDKKDEEPIKPGDDDKKDEDPTKPGDDDKKDEEPTKPGDDDKKDQEPTKPGDDDKKDEDPTKPGDDDKKDQEPTKPGDDDKKDEEPTKPGDDDKKDEEPTKPEDDESNDKKDSAIENSNSGNNGGLNSNNGSSQSNGLNSNNQNGTSPNEESIATAKNPNRANSGLPQTGSDTELKFIVLIAGTIFLITAIHTYIKVKNS